MKELYKLLLTFMMVLCANFVFGQNVTISGNVTEEGSNEPILGVTVRIEGTTIGTATDLDGNFAIKANETEGKNLIFSFIGYKSQVVALTGGNQVANVVLATSSTELDAVVVTALGIKKEAKSLGYSLTEVGGDELSEVKTTSAVNALQGRVAGVNISNNSAGSAGSSRVIIRGASSLTGDNQPLYVIDGIPVINKTNGSVVGPFGGEHGDGGDDISTLNPDDIESLSVLKGSSAAALYGSLASNGVIMITTKSGKGQKKLGVEYSSSYTFDKVNTDLLDLQTDYGHGDQGLKPGFEYDTDGNIVEYTGAEATDDAYTEGLLSWGAAFDGSEVIDWKGDNVKYSDLGSNIDKFYNTGTTATNTLALSKGGDNYNYRFSFSNLDNKDIFPNSTLNRKSFSLNASANINPRIVSTVNVKYSTEKVHNRVTIGDTPGNANTVAWLLPSSLDIYNLKPGETEDGVELQHQPSQFRTNPYWAANRFNNDDVKNRLIGAATLKFNVTDWLYLLGRTGIDNYGLSRKRVTPLGTAYRPAGIFYQGEITNTSINSDVMLGIDKNLTSKISTSTILGVNSRSVMTSGLSAQGSGFIVPDLEDLNNTTLPEPVNIFSETKTNSVYGSLGMDYDRKFYLTFTGRNDWFSTLSFPGKTTPNNDFYYSVSGSLLLNEIMTLPAMVDFLKVRSSYAQVAGGARTPYALNLDYAITGSFQGQSFGQLNGNSIPNADLVPFQKNEFEIGLDARFFKNRLYLDAAFYSNLTSNDIVTAAAAPSSGYSSAILNIGELSNKGIEFLVGGTPIKNSSFAWNTSFNVGYNLSEIVSTDDAETIINVDGAQTRSKNGFISHIVGERYGVIYGTTYERDSVSGKIVYDMSGTIPKPIQGKNEVLGQGVAPLTLGFYNSLTYKSFALGFLIDGKFGGSVHSGTNLSLITNGLHQSTLEGRENGLEVSGIDSDDGSEFTVTVPVKDLRTYYGNIAAENTGIAEAFIYSTDFIKLRELSLSYTLPKNLLKSIYVDELRVSVVGRNLLFLHKEIENVDPEASLNNMNSQGIERFGIPATRSLGFSLNVKF